MGAASGEEVSPDVIREYNRLGNDQLDRLRRSGLSTQRQNLIDSILAGRSQGAPDINPTDKTILQQFAEPRSVAEIQFQKNTQVGKPIGSSPGGTLFRLPSGKVVNVPGVDPNKAIRLNRFYLQKETPQNLQSMPREFQGTVEAVKKQVGFLGIEGFLQRNKIVLDIIRTKQLRNQKLNLGERALLLGLGFTTDVVGNVYGTSRLAMKTPFVIAKAPSYVYNIVKNPKNIITDAKIVGKTIKKSAEDFGKLLDSAYQVSPEYFIGTLGGEYVTFKGTNFGLKITGKLTKDALSKIELGTGRTAKDIFGVKSLKLKNLDVELIPPGRMPKLESSPLKAISGKEIKNQLRDIPKLPSVNSAEKRILNILRNNKGNAVTGSFAQEALLKKQFTRRHKDLDIVTQNRKLLLQKIKKEFGKDVKFKKLKVSIEVIYKGKPIADIVQFSEAEGGYLAREGILTGLTEHKGIILVEPRIRLAAKIYQLQLAKTPAKAAKIRRDIELLFGKKINLNKPSVRGAYGFTKKELEKYIGKTGPLATSQSDFLPNKLFQRILSGEAGKEIMKKGGLKSIPETLKRYLFVTPFDLKTGAAQTRISRLGIGSQEAGLLDLLRGNFQFQKNKAEIFIFPREKIYRSSTKVIRRGFTKTSKGFVIPFFSSEIEAILGKGYAIARGKKLGTRVINNEFVKISELKKIKLTEDIKKSLRELANINHNINLSKNSKIKKELISLADLKKYNLNKKLKKLTGFDYYSSPKKINKFFPLKRKILSTSSSLSKVSKPRIKYKIVSNGLFGSRRIRINSRSNSISRGFPKSPSPSRIQSPPKSPGTSPPRYPPKSPPKSPPITPPKILPRLPPKLPLSQLPKRFRNIPRSQLGFNVYGKSGKTFIKLNKAPLTEQDALARGAFAIDNTTSKTLKIVPIGRVKKFGTINSFEKNYHKSRAYKFRPYKIKNKRKKLLSNTYIEKRKYGIDTRGEKRQLSLARLLKRLNVPKKITSNRGHGKTNIIRRIPKNKVKFKNGKPYIQTNSGLKPIRLIKKPKGKVLKARRIRRNRGLFG